MLAVLHTYPAHAQEQVNRLASDPIDYVIAAGV
jgi:hypothetical protein